MEVAVAVYVLLIESLVLYLSLFKYYNVDIISTWDIRIFYHNYIAFISSHKSPYKLYYQFDELFHCM